VQLSHGLAEHAGRYGRLARALNAAGYFVDGHDHRGHGATGEASGDLSAFHAGFQPRTGFEWLSRDDADPLAGGGALIQTLGQRYLDAGVADATVRLFPEARHRIFNETNRDEATEVVIDWLDEHQPADPS